MPLELQVEPTVDSLADTVLHGCHMACQVKCPFVTLQCGKIGNWDEYNPDVDKPYCPICWNSEYCIVCGGKLVKS